MEQHITTKPPPCMCYPGACLHFIHNHCCSSHIQDIHFCRYGLPVHHVVTDSSVLAGLTGTLIHIKLTVDAGKPGKTLTGVRANQVMTGGSVVAGARLTLIDFSFTVDSC